MNKTGLFFIVFIIQIVTIPFFHIPLFPDGINVLALGFMARGENWSQYLIADGYYYKYGQMLLYFPFIYLIRNNIVLYRVLLSVNAVMVSFIPVCVFEIMTKHLKSTDYKKNFCVSLLVGLLPAVTLNSKYTWTESTMLLLPWLILLLLLKNTEADCSEKKKYFYSIFIAALQVYAYMLHTRGIVVLIATLLCVLFVRIILKNKNIKLIPYFVITVLLCVVDLKFGKIFRNILYEGTENLAGGTLGIINKEFIVNLFSLSGFKILGEEILGWLFASVTGTFGLVGLGLVVSVIILLCFMEWEKQPKQVLIIVVFSFLCMIGSLALGTVFFFSDIYSVDGVNIANRGDKLIYARYLNPASVCTSFIGLYYIFIKNKFWTSKRLFYGIISFVLLHGFFLSVIAERINHTVIWIQNLITINYFCDFSKSIRGGLYSTAGFLSGGIAVFSLFSFFVFFVAVLNRKNQKLFFSLYLIVFLSGYFWNAYNSIYRPDAYVMKIIKDYEDIIETVHGEEELTNIYLDDEILRSSFQYVFSDYYVLTRRDDNRYDIQNMFIISYDETYNEILFEDDYFEIVDMEDANADYHMYIKGENLNKVLQEKGYATCKIKGGVH